jgi:hypothetical protein
VASIQISEALTLTNSVSGAISARSEEFLSATVDVASSTVTGGLNLDPGTLTMTNSTISGGLLIWDDCRWGPRFSEKGESGVTATVSSSTIQGSISICDAVLTLTSTLVDGDCVDAAGDVLSGGYNIESPGNTCGLDHASDLFDVPDLNLGPLADNGGLTPTIALLPDSVAIDVIPGALCALPADQRGVTRPQTDGCDVGAFEYVDCTGSLCDDGNELYER